MLRAILCAAALMLAPVAHAADLDRTRALLVDDDLPGWIEGYVVDLSGPWSLLAIDDEAALAAAVPRHFDPDAIFAEILARTAQALRDADLDAILAWRASPPGARITAAEQAYQPPDCSAPDNACGDALARMEINADPRLGPIRALNARGHFARMDLAIEVAIMRASLYAAADHDAADIEDMLASYVHEYSAGHDRWHDEISAEIYAPFTRADIVAYGDFLASDAAQIYLLATGGALRDALADRAARLGREFAGRPPTADL